MSTYVVGDLQGCLDPLQRLLDQVRFDPSVDRLWLVGDLVNRGEQSLECLRFAHSLGAACQSVLGNHDIHLLALAHGMAPNKGKDTLDPILQAHDRDTLLDWLRQRPLLHQEGDVVMVHAGIPPCWDIQTAHACAREVENQLRGEGLLQYLAHLYGNQPDQWRDNTPPPARWRLITNYFTRMRFCSPDGQLELTVKESAASAPEGFAPWFDHPRQNPELTLLFGHWAALEGRVTQPNLFALDTGYIWGGPMRMLRLEDRALLHCDHQGCLY